MSANLKTKSENLCKNLPKSMIKYVNMLTCLCPHCKINGVLAQCSKDHLQKNHGVDIDTPEMVINCIQKSNINQKKAGTFNKRRNERIKIMEEAESCILYNIEKLKSFINS